MEGCGTFDDLIDHGIVLEDIHRQGVLDRRTRKESEIQRATMSDDEEEEIIASYDYCRKASRLVSTLRLLFVTVQWKDVTF